MKRTLPLLLCLAAAVLGLPLGASASAIFFVNGANVNSYLTSGATFEPSFATSGSYIRGMAIGAGGTIYIASKNTNEIYSYTTAGVQSNFASVSSAIGVAVNGSGEVFTSSNNVIEELSADGTTVIDSAFSGVGTVDSLAIDPNGNLWEGDNNGYLSEFLYNAGTNSYASSYSAHYAVGGISLDGITFDNHGDVFVSYENSTVGTGGGIVGYSSTGSTIFSYNNTANSFNPTGVSYDAGSNDLFFTYLRAPGNALGGADYINLSSPATVVSFIGSTGLNQPYGVATYYFTPEPDTLTMLLGGLVALSLSQVRRFRKQ